MNRARLLGGMLCLLLWAGCDAEPEGQVLRRGLTLRETGLVRTGTYLIPGDSGSGAVVTVHGRNIEIDFQGAVLQGSSNGADSSQYQGTGLCIDQASKVSLKNLRIRGYRTGLLCKSCEDLVMDNVDLSDNLVEQEKVELR